MGDQKVSIMSTDTEEDETQNLLSRNDPLPKAVLQGDVDKLKDLLKDSHCKTRINNFYEDDTEVNKQHQVLKTLLYIAAEKGYKECLVQLIKNEADLNKRSSHNKTPLYIAAEKGNRDCLIKLLENGANKDKGGPCGTTPAFVAALKKRRNCLIELIKRGASVKRSKTIFENNNDAKNLHEAIEFGQVTNLKKLIDSTKDSMLKIIGNRDETGKTLFHLAVENNQSECLNLLIELVSEDKTKEEGTNSKDISIKRCKDIIDKPNVYGHTPLYVAALLKNDCFDLLKKKGASFTKASYSAALEGEKECLECLIQEDIDLSYKGNKRCLKKNDGDDEEITICDLACVTNNIECFSCNEENVNDDEGETQCLKCFVEEDEKEFFIEEDEEQQECLFHEHDDPCSGSLVEEIFAHVSEPVEFISDVFNSVSVDIEKSKNKEKIYKANFKIFLPKGKENQGQMHVFSCLLNAMNGEEEVGVLNHIFCEIFLDAKLWTKTLFCILFIRLLVWYGYFICVLLYTAVVLKIIEFSSDHKWIISATSIFLIIRFLMQVNQIRLLWNDHRSRTYSMWTAVNCVLVMGSVMFTIFYLIITVSFINTNSMLRDTELSTVKSVSAMVIVILHNIEFILIHLKFTVVSKYYTMFLTVLYKTLKAIGFLFLPILCFILIFHIQFSYYSEFSTLYRTFVKTLVLMTGEFEYENTLHNGLPKNIHNTVNEEEITGHLQFFYVRFTFLVFIILINVVLLNLIVGISVDNVAMAKKTGNAVSIRLKAEFCIQVEEFLQFMKKCCIGWTKNIAICVENQSKVDSIYEMKRSKFALLRQKTFDAMDELVRNTNLSKKQKKLSTLLYKNDSIEQVKTDATTTSKDIVKIGFENIAQTSY